MFSKKLLMKNAKRCLTGVLATAMIASSLPAIGIMPDVTAEAAVAELLSDNDRGVIYANSRTDFRDESIYFLITTRFYDGDKSNNARTSEDKKAQNPEDDPSWRGDFKGLIDKLDYIKALGFTAIWITPVVENNSGYDYHGYHAYNFNAVDKRYESNGITYQDLIDACHAKGIKVIQDVVLNHTCNWGEKNLLQITSDIYSERNQVVMNGSGDPDNIYHHNGFCGGGDWDNYSAQDKTIADDCFDLETENPTVYNYLIDAYKKYINMGVDGFRVDTVKHISRLTFNSTFLPAFREAGGEDFYMFGEVCTKGHDVWYRDCPPISTCFYTWADPESWTSKWSTDTASNEKLVQDHYQYYNNTGVQPTSDNAFLNGNEYHTPDTSEASGMNSIDFQMHWSFNTANGAFNTALGEDRYFNDSTWNVVYVDSHDYGPDECQTLRYNGGTDAWAENLSLMFTFRGIPCIYYGSEIEFQAGKSIDVGPNQPLSQTGRAYFGDNIEGSVTSSDFTVFGNVDGKVAETLDSTLSQHIMRLNRIRQAVPALRKGQYSTEGCNGNMAFKRRYTDANTDSFALVAISGDATFTGIPNGKYTDAVTGDVQNVTNGTLSAKVSGKANMKVYVLDTDKTKAPGRVVTNGDYLTDGGAATKIGPVPIDVVKEQSVTLDKSEVTLKEGETDKVTATVAPDNATYKNVTWSSADENVATVNGGTIIALGVGETEITAKTYSGLTAKVKVKVIENPAIIKVTGISVDTLRKSVYVGDEFSIGAKISPSNATNKTVTWTTSDSKIATVDSTGKVKAVGKGTAIITATASNGFKAATEVIVAEQGIYLTPNTIVFEKPAAWGNGDVYAYFYDGQGTVGAAWPGTKMTSCSGGRYTFECGEELVGTNVIFNSGSNKTKDGVKVELLGYYTDDGFIDYASTEEIGTTVEDIYDTTDSTTESTKETESSSKEVTSKEDTSSSEQQSTIDVSTETDSTISRTTEDESSTEIETESTSKEVTTKQESTKQESTKQETTKETESNTESKTSQKETTKEVTTETESNTEYKTSQKETTKETGTETESNTESKTSQEDTTKETGTETESQTSKEETTTEKETEVEKVLEIKEFKANKNTGTRVGDQVRLSVKTANGAGGVKYMFVAQLGTNRKIIKNYSTASSVVWKPAKAGTYTLYVYAKDKDNTIAIKKISRYKVSAPKMTTSFKATSSYKFKKGKNVKLSAGVKYGTAKFKYKFAYRIKGSRKYVTIKSYSFSRSANFKPAKAGTYYFYVYAKNTSTNKIKTLKKTVRIVK